MSELPDIFNRHPQGTAVTKKSLKKTKKQCDLAINNLLDFPEPCEENMEQKKYLKKKHVKKNVKKNVKDDFDWLSVSETPLIKIHGPVESTDVVELQAETQTLEEPAYTEPRHFQPSINQKDVEEDKEVEDVHSFFDEIHEPVESIRFSSDDDDEFVVKILGDDEKVELQVETQPLKDPAYTEPREPEIDENIMEETDRLEEITRYEEETTEALPEEVEELDCVYSEDFNSCSEIHEPVESFSNDDDEFVVKIFGDDEKVELQVETQPLKDPAYTEPSEPEIDENIMEETDRLEEITRYEEETTEALPEEVEELDCVYSEDFNSCSEKSEISVQEDVMSLRASLQEALEREARTKASLEEALEREARTKASLEEALKKDKAQQEAQGWKEKTLEKTLKEAEAEKDHLRAVIDSMKAQVADLMKSQMSFKETHKMQRNTITAMTAELDESKKLIIELQKDLEASTLQQQEKSLEKDNEIQSLNVKLQTFQMTIEAKDNTISTLQKKVDQSASDLKEEETKNSELKRDYEAVIHQQQKDEEKQDLIQQNEKLTSENKRLQNKLDSVLNKRQLPQNEPQEDEEACSRLEEDIQVEKARYLRACKKIQTQREELAEKTVALKKSLAAEKYLRSAVRKEKKRFDQMIFQKQNTADPDEFLKNQLREASANSECLIYDMQTLRMDNAGIIAKFNITETEFDKLKSKHASLSERYQEMMSQKDETISEHQRTITKLQCKKEKLVDIITKERTKNSELQQKLDQTSSALEKERTTCEKQHVELMEASTKQMTILEELRSNLITHRPLKIRYETLLHEQGNQPPELIPLRYTPH